MCYSIFINKLDNPAPDTMNEQEVLLKTHNFFKSHYFNQQNVARLYTDVHSTLLPYKELAPFQRFTLDLGDFVMHPDLVGQLNDGETIFAVEVKGETDLLRGLAQAEMYQLGFHYSFLAADVTAWGTSLVDFAKQKNVGVLAISDSVSVAHLPKARMPLRDTFQFITRQMESVIQVSQGLTFDFNIPTHYLAWAIVLKPYLNYPLATLPNELGNYPMPKDWDRALRGAQKLGIVRILGNVVELTPVGQAVKEMLPTDVSEWTKIHEKVGAKGSGIPLVEYRPQYAAVLRLLLLSDPITRLIIEGLQTFPNHQANFAELAVACDQLDHARAPILFLKSEAAVRLTDNKGKVNWNAAQAEHFRSRTFYQYKSILKHAGILQATKLGYDPFQDLCARFGNFFWQKLNLTTNI